MKCGFGTGAHIKGNIHTRGPHLEREIAGGDIFYGEASKLWAIERHIVEIDVT